MDTYEIGQHKADIEEKKPRFTTSGNCRNKRKSAGQKATQKLDEAEIRIANKNITE